MLAIVAPLRASTARHNGRAAGKGGMAARRIRPEPPSAPSLQLPLPHRAREAIRDRLVGSGGGGHSKELHGEHQDKQSFLHGFFSPIQYLRYWNNLATNNSLRVLGQIGSFSV